MAAQADSHDDWKNDSIRVPSPYPLQPGPGLKAEMRRIRLGYVATSMDEKSNVNCNDDHLYLHRSSTGHCIYQAKFGD